MFAKSAVMQCFRDYYLSKHYVEVIPPTLVQGQVEGGSTLFSFNYFGEEVRYMPALSLNLLIFLFCSGTSLSQVNKAMEKKYAYCLSIMIMSMLDCVQLSITETVAFY